MLRKSLDGILFADDIEKAFDSVEPNFIYTTLRKFGSGDTFVSWVKTLFKEAEK